MGRRSYRVGLRHVLCDLSEFALGGPLSHSGDAARWTPSRVLYRVRPKVLLTPRRIGVAWTWNQAVTGSEDGAEP